MGEKNYIVAGSKSWNRKAYDDVISKYEGNWHYVSTREELKEAVKKYNPRYVFFLHWSWIVPGKIVENYECVCFHMTDVPYGRGGSPLQNLIVRGHKSTKLTALKMVEALDAGPVYMKEELPIDRGPAREIYTRATYLSAGMIKRLIEENTVPVPQKGDPVLFKRRTPAESEMPEIGSLEAVYDFIRMLDAEGYPPAFLRYKGVKFEFSGASLQDDSISANVKITRNQK